MPNFTDQLVFVFDFDGVIIESTNIKKEGFINLFTDVTEQQSRKLINFHLSHPEMNRSDKIVYILENILGQQSTDHKVTQILKRFQDIIWDALATCEEVCGIRALLKSANGQPCYIVSASPHQELQSLVKKRNFFLYFKGIYGSPPDKIFSLRKIAEIENVSVKNIIFIGDRLTDYIAATTVGCRFIGRNIPNQPLEFPPHVKTIENFFDQSFNSLACFEQTAGMD